MTLNSSQYDKLLNGEIVFTGGHGYAMCQRCRGLVKATGWFKGWHFCG